MANGAAPASVTRFRVRSEIEIDSTLERERRNKELQTLTTLVAKNTYNETTAEGSLTENAVTILSRLALVTLSASDGRNVDKGRLDFYEIHVRNFLTIATRAALLHDPAKATDEAEKAQILERRNEGLFQVLDIILTFAERSELNASLRAKRTQAPERLRHSALHPRVDTAVAENEPADEASAVDAAASAEDEDEEEKKKKKQNEILLIENAAIRGVLKKGKTKDIIASAWNVAMSYLPKELRQAPTTRALQAADKAPELGAFAKAVQKKLTPRMTDEQLEEHCAAMIADGELTAQPDEEEEDLPMPLPGIKRVPREPVKAAEEDKKKPEPKEPPKKAATAASDAFSDMEFFGLISKLRKAKEKNKEDQESAANFEKCMALADMITAARQLKHSEEVERLEGIAKAACKADRLEQPLEIDLTPPPKPRVAEVVVDVVVDVARGAVAQGAKLVASVLGRGTPTVSPTTQGIPLEVDGLPPMPKDWVPPADEDAQTAAADDQSAPVADGQAADEGIDRADDALADGADGEEARRDLAAGLAGLEAADGEDDAADAPFNGADHDNALNGSGLNGKALNGNTNGVHVLDGADDPGIIRITLPVDDMGPTDLAPVHRADASGTIKAETLFGGGGILDGGNAHPFTLFTLAAEAPVLVDGVQADMVLDDASDDAAPDDASLDASLVADPSGEPGAGGVPAGAFAQAVNAPPPADPLSPAVVPQPEPEAAKIPDPVESSETTNGGAPDGLDGDDRVPAKDAAPVLAPALRRAEPDEQDLGRGLTLPAPAAMAAAVAPPNGHPPTHMASLGAGELQVPFRRDSRPPRPRPPGG